MFFDNLAVGGGGAVSAFSNSDIDFVNCTLTGNRADTSGGAGDGGAFWSGDDCDSSMVNTILTDNSAAGTGDQLALEGSATNSVKHCFIEGSGGSGASWDSDLGVDNGGNIDRTSAGFTRSSNPIGSDGIWATSDDGLRLSASSPCRDSGNDAAALLLSADITGRNRTVNAVDIGAYESQ